MNRFLLKIKNHVKKSHELCQELHKSLMQSACGKLQRGKFKGRFSRRVCYISLTPLLTVKPVLNTRDSPDWVFLHKCGCMQAGLHYELTLCRCVCVCVRSEEEGGLAFVTACISRMSRRENSKKGKKWPRMHIQSAVASLLTLLVDCKTVALMKVLKSHYMIGRRG